jgi:hypothetical protein
MISPASRLASFQTFAVPFILCSYFRLYFSTTLNFHMLLFDRSIARFRFHVQREHDNFTQGSGSLLSFAFYLLLDLEHVGRTDKLFVNTFVFLFVTWLPLLKCFGFLLSLEPKICQQLLD